MHGCIIKVRAFGGKDFVSGGRGPDYLFEDGSGIHVGAAEHVTAYPEVDPADVFISCEEIEEYDGEI
ncbi:MAG: hypothetical protein ACRDO2_10440 [Nocardioidaceae bacterium]